MKISVRVHEVYDNENSKVKGLASAALGGQFAVNGIKIVEGKKGLFVTMPSKENIFSYIICIDHCRINSLFNC